MKLTEKAKPQVVEIHGFLDLGIHTNILGVHVVGGFVRDGDFIKEAGPSGFAFLMDADELDDLISALQQARRELD